MKRLSSLLIGMLIVFGVDLAGVLVGLTRGSASVVAQENNTAGSPTAETANLTGKPRHAENITGSIPLQSTIGQALRSEIEVSMSEAVTSAQNNVGGNSSVVAAFLSSLKGFLVYDVAVIDSNNTVYKVIIDPGNGQILYTSEGRQLDSFHLLMPGPHRHGKEFGHERGLGYDGSGQFSDWKQGHGRGYGQGGGGLWHSR